MHDVGMEQETFELSARGMSQTDKLIDRLQTDLGTWVSLPTLVGYTGAYAVHSRVSDARKRGCVIEQKTVRQEDGSNHSFYRLLQP
jgi:hypothetical protein